MNDAGGQVGWVPAEYVQVVAPGSSYVVSGTGGDSANLRVEPKTGKVLVSWPDGAVVVVVGPDRVVDGQSWKNVRDLAGHQGWMLAQYLSPLSSLPAEI